MRHIYLIRHGQPAFPNGIELCIGRTDLPISEEGERRARLLGEYFSEKALTAVYCSTLIRSVQTARALCREGLEPIQIADLQELDSGLWENLSFDEIKEKFPGQYARRGSDPEGFSRELGESFHDGLSRFRSAMERVINESSGNIAVVAHASVNRLFLCSLQGKNLGELYTIPQPYGCINEITMESGVLSVGRVGFLPFDIPEEIEIKSLWKKYRTPENVIAHCGAVADKAVQIAGELEKGGLRLDKELIYASALLHDIARTESNHAEQGAKLLVKEGFDRVAAIVACHHDLGEGESDPVTEKTVLYLADKLVFEDREVTLDERFAQSAAKCEAAEASAAHEKKYRESQTALKRVQNAASGCRK